ncbi:hypothetical protein E2F47_23540 [Mycobacterium eburneum]|nr:hypothetical protein [Mycobacterium eburneum]TDH48493.1 hypothetical protein E2F47_23540 [Mycobacterium eburneum]
MFAKDPSAVLDYTIDWTAWLPAGDTIVSAVWTPSAGVGIGAITAPASLAVSTQNQGGSLAAGTYYWVVTATNAKGETTVSNEVNGVTTGSTGAAVLTWQAVGAATGYKVYRGTAAGAENVLVATIGSGATVTYTDTGGSAAGTPPTSNTAITEASTNTTTTATAWISGVAAGQNGTATCHITTAAGRQDSRTITIAGVDL